MLLQLLSLFVLSRDSLISSSCMACAVSGRLPVTQNSRISQVGWADTDLKRKIGIGRPGLFPDSQTRRGT